MRKVLLSILTMAFCFMVTGCKKEKSRIENAAGDLKAEIEYFYDFFVSESEREPDNAAWIWCDVSHSSWRILSDGVTVAPEVSDDYDYKIAQVTMHKDYYSAKILSEDYETICQLLSTMFGESSSPYEYNRKYAEWEKGDVRISAEYIDHMLWTSISLEKLN